MRDFVFGYGSLVVSDVTRRRDDAGFVADVHGARRGWGVAMDNRVDLPGYKCYLDGEGRRPPVSVCFLDIEFEPSDPTDTRVNGVCLPVSAAELEALDRRERNYDRVEVSERLADCDGARVWSYRGSVAGRARFGDAVRAGTAVIDAGYLESVRAGFLALGEAEWASCAASLDPAGLPVAELVRCELP